MGFGCSVGFSPQQQVAMAGFGFFGFQRIGTKRVFGFSGSGYFKFAHLKKKEVD
jgi:hypothetical protein